MEGAISESTGQVVQLSTTITEEEVYAHYLDKIFGVYSIFHNLPKDVQYVILSYLPNPFRPVRPTKVRKITHDQLIVLKSFTPLLSMPGSYEFK